MSPLTVAEIMTREIFAVAPDTSLTTAARLFATRHISGAPGIDAPGKPLGVVTQTDLCDPDRDRTDRIGRSLFYRVSHHPEMIRGDDALSPEGVVADVMSPFILSVRPETALMDAAKLMVDDDV